MGIAGFFYTWLRSQKLIGTSVFFDVDVALKDIPNRKYRSLSLDIPGIIHESTQKVWCYGSCSGETKKSRNEQELMDMFYGEVFSRILNIVKLFHNEKNKLDVLIIALDGKAPVAKMNEQRMRRYISKMENPNYSFDSAKISPGTDFMADLDERLYEWINNNTYDGVDSSKPFPGYVIYSSCFSPGEAEHKIMDYYRSQTNTDGGHVLYGSDNDLILLSLVSPINGIIVVREEKQKERKEEFGPEIMGGTSDEKREQQLKRARYMEQQKRKQLQYSRTYVDIDKFKILLKELGMQLKDYVLLMNFVGNDFLPTQPIFEVKSDSGWDALFQIYKQIRDKLINERKVLPTEDILIDDQEIIWENLLLILKEMMLVERGNKSRQSLIIANSQQLLKGETGSGFIGDKSVEPKSFEDFYPKWYQYKIFNDVEYKVRNTGRGKAKKSTIEEVLKYPPDTDTVLEIRKMTLDYLKIFNWVNQYYITGYVDWETFYPYKYSPLIIDIYNVLKSLADNGDYNYINDIYPDPDNPKGNYGIVTQLISILPKQSFDLLPTPLDVLPDTELKELFPDAVVIDSYKARKYQKIAKIPNVNIELVFNVVDRIIQEIYHSAELEMYEEDTDLAKFYERYLAQLSEQEDIVFNPSGETVDWDSRGQPNEKLSGKQKTWEEATNIEDKTITLVYYEDPGIRWRLNSINFINVTNGLVSVPYSKLTEYNRPEIIKTISEMIKNDTIKFPYSRYFMEKPEVLIQNKTEAAFVEYPKWDSSVKLDFFETENGNPKVILYKDSDYERIDIITNWFTEEPRAEAIFTTSTRKHRRTLLEGWKDEAEYITSRAFIYAINHRSNLDTKALSEGIFLARDRVPSCTTFKVSVAIVINNVFKSKIVFDPFAGWGDRAIGAIMSDTCVRYIGTDPNSKLWKGHAKIRNFLEKSYPGKKVTMSHSPIEEFLYDAYFKNEQDRPDLIFSGPPYFDYEIYSEEETQSHIKYNTPEKWQVWLNENTKKAFEYLKVDCYLVYYISKCGEINIPKMLKEYMKSNVKNSEYKGWLPIVKEDGRPLFCHVWKKISA